ncbi:MAG: DEAD/DEAH box helicase, partial [Streptosporangiaceae bacterium]
RTAVQLAARPLHGASTWRPADICGHPNRKTTYMTAQPIEYAQPAPSRRRRRPRTGTTSTAPSSPSSFAELGVPAPLVEALSSAGIVAPFPIQAAVLPDALAGTDILGRGRTGSGKTLGFSIPLVARLADGYTSAGRPRGMVLVPTRELASQVQEVLVPLASAVGLTVGTIFGGTSQKPQVAALHDRVDIIVACPGRLTDLIDQGHCHLGDVEISVVDEADHMADLGFLPVVRRLLDVTPDEGQRMLFSATLDNAVDVLIRRFLSNPAEHAVDPAAAAPAALVHHLLTITPADRMAIVAALAGGDHRSLIFTRTKHGAHKLARQLTAARISATELHGDLAQGTRERNLAAFSSGAARVLVATDIAARGIHVDAIDLVIHADAPVEHKVYLHRSGRTARAGASGVVVTLQTQAQSSDVRALMRKAGVVPLAASVAPGSALLATIAGPPAAPVSAAARQALAPAPTITTASPASGSSAVAMSAGYRGRRRAR